MTPLTIYSREMIKRRVTWMVAATIGLAACGGGGESATDTADRETQTSRPTATAPPTTTPVTTTPVTTEPAPANTEPAATAPPTTEPAPPATEAELAASVLITLDDLPEGWTETPFDPNEDNSDDEAVLAAIAECAGLDLTLINRDVLGDTRAESSEFESGEEVASVKHVIGFASDELTARAAMVEVGNPALPDCYAEAVKASFEARFADPDPTDSVPAEVVLGDLVAERVDLTNIAAEDEAVWVRVVASLTVQGDTLEQHVHLIFLRSGRVLSQVHLGGSGEPFPEDLFDPIISLAVVRAESIAD